MLMNARSTLVVVPCRIWSVEILLEASRAPAQQGTSSTLEVKSAKMWTSVERGVMTACHTRSARIRSDPLRVVLTAQEGTAPMDIRSIPSAPDAQISTNVVNRGRDAALGRHASIHPVPSDAKPSLARAERALIQPETVLTSTSVWRLRESVDRTRNVRTRWVPMSVDRRSAVESDTK